MITTQSTGITGKTADPKPCNGIDYAGQPIKPAGFYNGRPEHMQPVQTAQSNPSELQNQSRTHRKRKRIVSPERREYLKQYMRDYWAKRKAAKQANNP